MTTQPDQPTQPSTEVPLRDEHTPAPVEATPDLIARMLANRLTHAKEGVTTTTSMEENL